MVFAGIVASSSKKSVVKVKDHTVVKLKLNYYINDQTDENPFAKFTAGLDGNKTSALGLYDLLETIEHAKNDKKVDGLFLDLSSVVAGYGKLGELREALNDFKTSGKFIYAYGEIFYNNSYYIASVADKVYLNPSGTMIFNGMAADVTFVKETLAKLGVEMQAVKKGKYKGYVEPFVLDEMSAENRKQITEYLNSTYNHFLSQISASRGVSVDELKNIADSIRVRTPEDAVHYKMIDATGYRDEVMTALKTQVGLKEEEKLEMLEVGKYHSTVSEKKSKTQDKIAIIYADGSIVSGKGSSDEIGSDKFAKVLKKAREDKNVKAVVLRVNSPGGSAMASDVIWRETKLLRDAKPLIVSMGDVAASGGYFISCNADSILAMPGTLTGSIGVFGMYPNAQKLWDKLGLKSEVVKTSDMADFGRIDRPLTNAERLILEQNVDKIYTDFLTRVSEGRKLERTHLDTIAEGRVWTGDMAKGIGLIDEFGGIEKAIAIAAYKAHLKEYKVTTYPKSDNPFGQFMEAFGAASVKENLVKEELGDYYGVYQQLKDLKSMNGIQAVMPYMLEIR